MAAMQWDTLVQESERFSAEDNFGIPRPQRTLAQIQEHARQLRQNAGGVSSLSERRAAANLLSSALDTSALTKRTVNFTVDAVQQEAFPEDTWSVQEYMENMAQKNMARAIQARIDDSSHAFEAFMVQRMEADWAQERQQVLDAVMAPGWGATALALPGAPRTPPSAPSAAALASPASAPPPRLASPFPGPGGEPALTATQKAVVTAVNDLVDARNAGAPFDAPARFKAALAGVDAPEEPAHNRVAVVWDVLAAQLSSLRAAAAVSVGEKQRALLAGSLAHLETTYFEFVRKRVAEDRASALPGGSGSDASVLRAYVTACGARGPAARPSDPGFAWHEVYHCLRAGRAAAAAAAAEGDTLSVSGLHHVAAQLPAWLQQWRDGSGALPEAAARDIVSHTAAVLRAPEVSGNLALAKSVALVLCTLAGTDKPLNDAMVDAVPQLRPSVFTTIEDWLWFRCRVAHAAAPARASGEEGEGPLAALQADLAASPPAHYTRNGARPLQYVTVLLLTLQYERALAFLHGDAMTARFRDLAAVLAVVLSHERVAAVGEPAGGVEHRLRAATVIQQYARVTLGPVAAHGWTRAPREYLVVLRAAVDAQTEGTSDRARRLASLREALLRWLTDTQQFALLDKPLLDTFAPSKAGDDTQRTLLTHAAAHFEHSDPDASAQLYALAGAFGAALEQVNARLGRHLLRLARAAADDEAAAILRDCEALRLRGNELKDGHQQYMTLAPAAALSHDDRADLVAAMRDHGQGFADLLHIRDALSAARALPQSPAVDAVLAAARALSHWLPASNAQVTLFASKAADLQPYVRDLLPPVIMATAQALAAHASSPSLDPALASAARSELSNIKHFAVDVRKRAPGITLPVSFMQKLNAL